MTSSFYASMSASEKLRFARRIKITLRDLKPWVEVPEDFSQDVSKLIRSPDPDPALLESTVSVLALLNGKKNLLSLRRDFSDAGYILGLDVAIHLTEIDEALNVKEVPSTDLVAYWGALALSKHEDLIPLEEAAFRLPRVV